MRTIKQIIQDETINVETKPLSEDGGKLYVMLSMMQNTEGAMDEIVNTNQDEIEHCFICKVFLKRIEVFNLQDKVGDEMFLLTQVFEINNPGEAMLLLITLLDFHTEHNRKATMSDIGLELFPNGFYTHDTCMLLVDNYVKTGKTVNGFIY